MAESNFVDYVKIYCRSGKGGRGSTHMRREKYIPNGGPDGGDGGRGGHVILRGNRNYWTLLHLRYDRHIMAGHGESGSKNRSFGKDGEDKVIEVPCGTVVYNAETGEYICDVTEHGQEVVLLKGGRGGLGNWHFKTATRQAPPFRTAGRTDAGNDGYHGVEAVSGCRFGRFSQCRKVDTALGRIFGKAENRQLSLYHTGTQLGDCVLSRRQVIRDGGYPRHYRRRKCRQRFGTSLPAPHRTQLAAAVHGSGRQ